MRAKRPLFKFKTFLFLLLLIGGILSPCQLFASEDQQFNQILEIIDKVKCADVTKFNNPDLLLMFTFAAYMHVEKKGLKDKIDHNLDYIRVQILSYCKHNPEEKFVEVYKKKRGVEDTINKLKQMQASRKAISKKASPSSKVQQGTLVFKFNGQWFFGNINRLEIKITNKDSYMTYTESETRSEVYFTTIPYGSYDFNISAYEKSGGDRQMHALKGTVSHNCERTWVNIDSGGGFISPYINKSCF